MICQVICEQLLLAVLVTHIRPDTAELVGAIEAEQGRFFSLCFVFSGVIIIHIAKFENMKVLLSTSTFPPQSNCCIGIVLTKAPQQCPRDPPLRLSAPQVSSSGPPVECNNKTAAIRHRKHL